MTERSPLSASQWSTYVRCPRLWYYQSVQGIREPPASSAILGTAIHEDLERYLKDGTLPDPARMISWKDNRGNTVRKFPGQISTNMIPHLPRPGTAEVEKSFSVETPGASWRGAKDFTALTEKGYLVGDHKSTSSAAYSLSPQELLTNVQALLYAFETMQSKGVDQVQAQWGYMLTTEKPSAPNPSWATAEQVSKWEWWIKQRRPVAWPVRVLFTREHVEKELVRVDAVAQEIYQLKARKPDVEEVPVNLSGCNAFGGCPMAGRCTKKDSLTGTQGSGTFWDRLTSLDATLPQEGTEEMTDQKPSVSLSAILAQKKLEQQALAAAAGLPPAPPPPAEGSPKPWAPGDPLNQHQQLKLATGASLLAVAMAADNPPDEDEVLAWPNRKERYATVIADLEAAKALEAEALAKIRKETLPPPPPPVISLAEAQESFAEGVASPVSSKTPAEAVAAAISAGTPIGQPERGFINAPEGPAVAFKNPQELKAYQDAENEKLGLVPPAPPEEVQNPTGKLFMPFTDRDLAKKEAVRLGLVDEGCYFRLPRLNEILQEYALKGFTPAMTAGAEKIAAEISEKYRSALPPPPPMPGAIAARASSRPSLGGYVLVVSSFVTKGSLGKVTHFSEIASKAMEAFRQKWGQPLPGFVDFKGSAYFAHEVEKLLAGFGAGDVIYVDSRSNEGQMALARLEEHAALVLRGGF